MVDNTTSQTGIGNIDRKMEMLTSLIRRTASEYHDPIAFLSQIDATVQALRNFTWTIQANKKDIPDFDAWYAPWQARMKKQPYLRWLHDTRTDIVHKDTLTAESHATLELITDHVQKFTSKHFDIMTTTADMLEHGKETAEQFPALKHATGKITRSYSVEIENKPVHVLAVLNSCYAVMRFLHRDLAAYLKGEPIIAKDLPDLTGRFAPNEDELAITYKLRDASVISKHTTTVTREQLLKGADVARDRYGIPDLKHHINSTDKQEVVRGYFELSRTIFLKDGYHIPMLHMFGKDEMFMIQPTYRDRAEKIHFFRDLANTVRDKQVHKIIFITESWRLFDIKRVDKQLRSGKELSALRKKQESLDVLYIDSDGYLALMSAPILRDATDKKALPTLGELHESKLKPADYPGFASVFYEWGLVDKITNESADAPDEN
jgi:hypothetical protein